MIWGMKGNEKIKATPKQKANCEICNGKLIAKCGEIKIWHWSHGSNKDCDDWYEPESEWHRNWKNEFPPEQQEVRIGKHRADILTTNKLIIELQSSSISSKDMKERENYYGVMVWLLNGEKLATGLNIRKKGEILTFRWKHPPKSWWFAKKPVYIDLSNLYNDVEIFLIKKIYSNLPCGGWGIKISKKEFLEEVKYVNNLRQETFK